MQDSNPDQNTISEIAKKVLLEMGQKGVMLTPENYHVWFEYCTGSNEHLTAHINEIVASGKPFTPEISQRLYDTYFGKGKEDRGVKKAGQNLLRLPAVRCGFGSIDYDPFAREVEG